MTSEEAQAKWPTCDESTVYDYCFSVWPDETNPRIRASRGIFDLFSMMTNRVVMEFTDRDFRDFEEQIAKIGLTLREVEKVPHLELVGVR